MYKNNYLHRVQGPGRDIPRPPLAHNLERTNPLDPSSRQRLFMVELESNLLNPNLGLRNRVDQQSHLEMNCLVGVMSHSISITAHPKRIYREHTLTKKKNLCHSHRWRCHLHLSHSGGRCHLHPSPRVLKHHLWQCPSVRERHQLDHMHSL